MEISVGVDTLVVIVAVVTVGLFLWRVLTPRLDRVETKQDELNRDLQQVARELAELRGEVRGARSVQEAPSGPDTGIPPGRVVPVRGAQA